MLQRRLSADKVKPLAYIIGVYLGDGNISRVKSKNSHQFRLNTIDYDFVESTAEALLELTDVKPRIYSHPVEKSTNDNHYISHGCKLLCDYIESETDKKKRIPYWIMKERNKDILREFIAGLMDSEGSTSIDKRLGYNRYVRVRFCNSEHWTPDFMSILQKVGCTATIAKEKPYKASYKPMYRITINTKSFISSGCFFKIKRKQAKLDNLRDYMLCTER